MFEMLKNQIKTIKNDDNNFKTSFQLFKINFEIYLLYLRNKSNSNRLCVLEKIQKKFLQYAHDKHAHENIHKTYDLLCKSIFMPKNKIINQRLRHFMLDLSIIQVIKIIVLWKTSFNWIV